MDITIIQKDIIKIKGKRASFIAAVPSEEPNQLKIKTPADAVLFLNKNVIFDPAKVEGNRVVVRGPGDYEISGVKISVSNSNDDLAFIMNIDGMEVLLAQTETLKKLKDKINEYKVIILYANSDIDQSLITALEPSVAIFYGERAADCIKALGKTAQPVNKFSVTPDKLPAEMEAVLLSV